MWFQHPNCADILPISFFISKNVLKILYYFLIFYSLNKLELYIGQLYITEILVTEYMLANKYRNTKHIYQPIYCYQIVLSLF